MRKKIFISFSLITLFIFLISSQIHRPIFADECPLSCPISGPLTGPITGPSGNPTETPTSTPTLVPTVSILPSGTITDTPTIIPSPSVLTPTPTSTDHNHGGSPFGSIFRRFLALEALWNRFFQLFVHVFTSAPKKHISWNSHSQVLGISSAVQYIADDMCADESQKDYSRFDL